MTKTNIITKRRKFIKENPKTDFRNVVKFILGEAKKPLCLFKVLRYLDNEAIELMKLITANNNGAAKNIAEKGIDRLENVELGTEKNGAEYEVPKNGRPLTDRQVWCMAYEVWNNIEKYKEIA